MNFKEEIAIFRQTRENTLKAIESLTLEQLNEIPAGFTGNIAWHLGHMISTHRGLVYQLNSVPGGLDKEFILKFKKGTTPTEPLTQDEYAFIKNKMLSQADDLEEDLAKTDFFGENIPYNTSFGYEMTSLASCVNFNNVHQALHLGYIMALKRSLS